MSRKTPFDKTLPPAIAPTIIKGGRPPLDMNWNEMIIKVIKECWDPTPSLRPPSRMPGNQYYY